MARRRQIVRLMDRFNFGILRESPDKTYLINTLAFNRFVGQAVRIKVPKKKPKYIEITLLLNHYKNSNEFDDPQVTVNRLKDLSTILGDVNNGVYVVKVA